MDMVGHCTVSGGNDKNVTVFNLETEKIVASLRGHTKRVMRVAYHPTEVSLNYLSLLFSNSLTHLNINYTNPTNLMLKSRAS